MITILAYIVVRPQLLGGASDSDTGPSAAQCKTVQVYLTMDGQHTSNIRRMYSPLVGAYLSTQAAQHAQFKA